MTRELPSKPSLEHLKREAKQILKSLKQGDATNRSLLQHIGKLRNPSAAELPTLLDVQQALAVDYGFSDWAELKQTIESRVPELQMVRPALPMAGYDETVAHYIDWLGFNLEWEWREAPSQPAIIAITRDGIEIMLNQDSRTLGPCELHINVKNFDALIEEWNQRRAGSAEPRVAPPYEFPDLPITDPAGNVLVFEGQDPKREEARRETARAKMRAFVQAALDAGEPFPTPEALRDAIGPPLGVAVEVLNEFPGYGEVYDARHGRDGDDA